MTEPFVLLDDRIAGTVRHYTAPVRRIVAHHAHEVPACLEAMARALDEGRHLAGYVPYELGYALEPRLEPLMPEGRNAPLLCFAVFDAVGHEAPALPSGPAMLGPLEPAWSFEDYVRRFEKVIAWIRAGDVYQINLTFPLTGTVSGDPLALYETLCARQPVAYGGIVALGGPTLLSLSPELFFRLDGNGAEVRPMKGTAARGATDRTDAAVAQQLRADEKSRAENLMIVDLLRNDLGRISEIGSVEVTDLYSIETYPTLFQMTSGIRSRLRDDVGVRDLFRSLFPCGSVTGAPKIRAMEIIREIEAGPRGPYCGAIGFIDPDGTACFNVAIRTMSVFDRARVVYNVGSAIVWDSQARAEYEECLLKARFLTAAEPAARLSA